MKKTYIKPIIEIVKIDTDKNLLQGSWRKYTGHWLSRNGFNNNDNGFDFSAGGEVEGQGVNLYSNDGVNWYYWE